MSLTRGQVLTLSKDNSQLQDEALHSKDREGDHVFHLLFADEPDQVVINRGLVSAVLNRGKQGERFLALLQRLYAEPQQLQFEVVDVSPTDMEVGTARLIPPWDPGRKSKPPKPA